MVRIGLDEIATKRHLLTDYDGLVVVTTHGTYFFFITEARHLVELTRSKKFEEWWTTGFSDTDTVENFIELNFSDENVLSCKCYHKDELLITIENA